MPVLSRGACILKEVELDTVFGANQHVSLLLSEVGASPTTAGEHYGQR